MRRRVGDPLVFPRVTRGGEWRVRSKGGLGFWIRVYVVSSYIIWVQAISLIDNIVHCFKQNVVVYAFLFLEVSSFP